MKYCKPVFTVCGQQSVNQLNQHGGSIQNLQQKSTTETSFLHKNEF